MALDNPNFGIASPDGGRDDEGELTRNLTNAELHMIALDVSKKTPATYAQVSESLSRMQRMNMSLSQMTRAFSSMTQAGVSFAEATNAFSRAFNSIGATMQAQALKETVEAKAVNINRLMREFNLALINVLRPSNAEQYPHDPRHWSPIYFRYDVTTGEDVRIRLMMKFVLPPGMTFALAQHRVEGKVDEFANRFNVLSYLENVRCRHDSGNWNNELEYNYELLVGRIPNNPEKPGWEAVLDGLDKIEKSELTLPTVIKKRRRFLDL